MRREGPRGARSSIPHPVRTESAPAAPAADTTVPAVVLSVHDHGGLGAVRSLGRMGVPVHGTFLRDRDPARASRYLASQHTWDLDHRPSGESLGFLVELGHRIGGRAVLLPSEDHSAIFIAEHADALREVFLIPEQPPGLTRGVADKRVFHEICLRTGTPTPETSFPTTVAEVEAFAATATYPVVAKAVGGWLLRGTSEEKTIIAGDARELVGAAEAMAIGGELNLLLQEFVPGGADSIWTFMGYAAAGGELLASFIGNKQREYPVDRGLTTLTRCTRNDDVQRLAEHLVREIGYAGVVDLDFRLDVRDGTYKALDFNPRPGANFRAFVGTNGLDVVRVAYLDLTGQPVPATEPQLGRRWMVEPWDMVGARRYIGEGRLTVRAYLRSLRGVRETAWWARDDPRPFLRMAGRFAGFAAGWGARRARGR